MPNPSKILRAHRSSARNRFPLRLSAALRATLILCLVTVVGCATWNSVADAATPGPPPERSDKARAMNHYMASLLYERQGDVERAIEELRKAADLDPESETMRLKLLGAYYMNQDFENASLMAERAIAADPDSVLLHIWLGRIYFQLDRVGEAVETFMKAIELDPDSTVGYEALAEVEEETHDLVGALEVYERLLDIAPDSPFLHYRLGLNLAKINANEEALASLERAVELNSDLTPALYLAGLLYNDAKNYPKAEETLLKFLEKTPGNPAAMVNLAAAHALQGEFDEALAIYDSLLAGEQVDTRYHIDRMYLLLRKGNIASGSVATAPSGAPLVGTVFEALIRRAAGEPYGDLLAGIDQIDGDLDFETSAFLNGLLGIFGTEEAGTFLAAQFRSLLREDHRSRTLETMLGRAFMAMERNDAAKETLTGVLATYGPEKWLYYYLASVSDSLDEPEEAERYLKACLQLDPNDPDVMNFLGYLYAEENRNLDEAEELLQDALALDPDNGFYLDSLGWIYYRKGDAEKAVDLIKRAIASQDMESDDAILRDHLGDALLLSGDTEGAVAEWRRARRLDPELEGVQEKLDRYLPRISE